MLALDILQSRVQVAHLLGNILHFTLVGALDRASLSHGQVKLKLDGADGMAARQPAAMLHGVDRREANAVLAAIGGGEGEATLGGGAVRDDAVVVVEGLLDCDVDAEAIVGLVSLRVLAVLLCGIVA